jgi:single-strand DNA-binding protein
VNQVMLVGRLGADPEYTKTKSGKVVCGFRVATSRYSKQEGVNADWHQVSAWETLAETCVKYLKKGHKVAVLGRLQTDRYTTKEGQPRSMTKVIAQRVEFFWETGKGLPMDSSAPADESVTHQEDDIPF